MDENESKNPLSRFGLVSLALDKGIYDNWLDNFMPVYRSPETLTPALLQYKEYQEAIGIKRSAENFLMDIFRTAEDRDDERLKQAGIKVAIEILKPEEIVPFLEAYRMYRIERGRSDDREKFINVILRLIGTENGEKSFYWRETLTDLLVRINEEESEEER